MSRAMPTSDSAHRIWTGVTSRVRSQEPITSFEHRTSASASTGARSVELHVFFVKCTRSVPLCLGEVGITAIREGTLKLCQHSLPKVIYHFEESAVQSQHKHAFVVTKSDPSKKLVIVQDKEEYRSLHQGLHPSTFFPLVRPLSGFHFDLVETFEAIIQKEGDNSDDDEKPVLRKRRHHKDTS